MSTILKALRRLEQDADAAKRGRDAARDSVETSAVDEAGEALRDRILAEEAAAEALAARSGGASAAPADGTPGTPRSTFAAQVGVLALMGLAGFGLAFGVMQWMPGQGADSRLERESEQRVATVQPEVSPPDRAAEVARRAEAAAAAGAGRPAAQAGAGARDLVAGELSPLAARPPARAPQANVQAPSALESAAVTPTPAARALADEVAQAAEAAEVESAKAEAEVARAAREVAAAQAAPVPDTVIPVRPERTVAAVEPTPPARTPSVAPRRPDPTPRAAPEPIARAERRPAPTTRERTSAPAPVAAQPRRTAELERPRPSVQSPEPTPPPIRATEPIPREAASAPRTPIPDVAVLRTSWHPSPDRRSAKVRLETTGEELSLREGDAVGSLVVKAISPSAVTFQAGDVEVRRRVGAGRR